MSSRHYFSFNTSNGAAPLAESTAIGMPLSPQQERNQKRKTLSPLANSSKQRLLGSPQIESHILTNAQSRGIVKRLVTYYDESQNEAEKNRLVYNRVGDFPLVQLKKTEIKRKLIRSSSVRIAPPSKTIMNRDIRAAILRSNSFQLGANVPKLMPTKMRAKEDDAHQIITNHDPLHESPQTAKSVLDALEKNCRKRINNEELTLDRNKRICATSAQPEVVDSPSQREFATIVQQSAKRGREQVSPLKNNVNDSPYAQMRKRLRTRNNALLSSLSSSHYALKTFNPAPQQQPSKPLAAAASAVSQSKPQDEIDRQEKQLKEVSISSDKILPVVEPPPKPTQPEKRLHLFNARFDPNKRRVLAEDDDEPKINFVKPRENSQHSDIDILRHVETQKLSVMLSGLSDGFKSPTEEVRKDFVDAPASVSFGISFTTSTTSSTVAPIASPVSSTSPSVTESSSSNLLPSSTAATTGIGFSLIPSVATTPSNSLLVTATTTAVASSSPSTTSAVSSGAMTKPLVGLQFGLSSSTTSEVPKPSLSIPAGLSTNASTLTTTSSSLIDSNKSLISFTPIAKPSVVASTTSSMFGGFGLTQSKETTTGGFSLGSNASSNGFGIPNASTTTPATTNAATTSPPSFGFNTPATTAFSFGAKPAEPTATTTAPSFGLGAITATPSISGISGNLGSTVSFVQKPQTTPSLGGFSFSSSQPSLPAEPAKTVSSTFSFNAAGAAAATTANAMNFGSGGNAAFGQQTTTTASSSMTFGQMAATTTTSDKPAFGQATAPITGQSAVFGQPSGFSGFNQKPQETQQSNGMFSFGQTPVATTAATPSTFAFGGSNQAPVATQSSGGFSFGQSNPIQATPTAPVASNSIFSRLGDKQPEAKSAFSFGGNAQTPQQMSSPFGASNNALAPSSTPMFGSGSNNSTFNKPTNSVFGNSVTSPASNDFGGAAKPFSFGSNTGNQQQQQPSQPATDMFSFGGNANTLSNNSASSNIFGASSPTGTQNQQNVSASFTFKPSTGAVSNNSSANIFGQAKPQISSAAAPPAYQFGNSQIGNNVSASFTFGGSANGAQSSQPLSSQSAGFNFGGPQSAPAVGGGFNFQGAQPSLTPQPSSSGGLFSIGTGGNQQRRPMRQATRRMK